jgi:hypothetical protein
MDNYRMSVFVRTPLFQLRPFTKQPTGWLFCTKQSNIVLAERQIDRRERIKGGELPRIDLNQANMCYGACDQLGFTCPGVPGTLWFPAHAGGSRLSSFLPVLSGFRKTGNERPVR